MGWHGAQSEPERCLPVHEAPPCTTLAVRHASPRPSRYVPCVQLSHGRRTAGANRFDGWLTTGHVNIPATHIDFACYRGISPLPCPDHGFCENESSLWLELRRLPQILSPCSFLLWILTHKRFHSNLAIAPTCDTVSTYHITDKARDPQRGLSRATYLLKKSVAGRLWRAGRSAAGGGDAAASDLQIKGGGARQGTVKGTAAGKATGLHLGQGGRGG